jgi:cytochrome c-type biogenesis protein CcmE
MTRKAKRIWAVALILLGAGSATGLALTALEENVSFFYSPSDFLGDIPAPAANNRSFRLGGLVKDGSLTRNGLDISFTLTDNAHEMNVRYHGVPPDLFREGQGVIAVGKLGADNIFTAQSLLAKHDENYMPPEVAKALKKTAIEKGHPE